MFRLFFTNSRPACPVQWTPELSYPDCTTLHFSISGPITAGKEISGELYHDSTLYNEANTFLV